MAESSSKKPMSPSEFFAKIYGANDSKSQSESSSSAVTSPHPASNRWTETNGVENTRQSEPCWMYPAWHPDFWAARSFYNPLDITPALTALSTFNFSSISQWRRVTKFRSRNRILLGTTIKLSEKKTLKYANQCILNKISIISKFNEYCAIC